ncbi:hypothetical protein [Streptomyces sp. NPDC088196]|uniref:hypothetical protein n=1 Tax=Streptomyces sp. NPDC088196 TaxID=3154868 RepID=UPI00344B1F6C
MPRGSRWPLWGMRWMCLVFVVWAVWWFAQTMRYDVTVSVSYEGGSAGDTALVTFDASSY